MESWSHSVVRLFKKYGTQSSLRTLKLRQENTYNWVLEFTKHRDKKGELPRPKDGWKYSADVLDSFLPTEVRSMMRRNGGTEFLVRNKNNTFDGRKLPVSYLRGVVQNAFDQGCKANVVTEKLGGIRRLVEEGEIQPAGDYVFPLTEQDNKTTVGAEDADSADKDDDEEVETPPPTAKRRRDDAPFEAALFKSRHGSCNYQCH